MRDAREERLERISQAIADGEEPKHRDVRLHRRTLAHRSRKNRPFGLTITDRRLFEDSDDYQSLTSRQCGFSVGLRGDQSLQFLDIRSIRLVPVKEYRPPTKDTTAPPALLPARAGRRTRADAHRAPVHPAT